MSHHPDKCETTAATSAGAAPSPVLVRSLAVRYGRVAAEASLDSDTLTRDDGDQDDGEEDVKAQIIPPPTVFQDVVGRPLLSRPESSLRAGIRHQKAGSPGPPSPGPGSASAAKLRRRPPMSGLLVSGHRTELTVLPGPGEPGPPNTGEDEGEATPIYLTVSEVQGDAVCGLDEKTAEQFIDGAEFRGVGCYLFYKSHANDACSHGATLLCTMVAITGDEGSTNRFSHINVVLHTGPDGAHSVSVATEAAARSGRTFPTLSALATYYEQNVDDLPVQLTRRIYPADVKPELIPEPRPTRRQPTGGWFNRKKKNKQSPRSSRRSSRRASPKVEINEERTQKGSNKGSNNSLTVPIARYDGGQADELMSRSLPPTLYISATAMSATAVDSASFAMRRSCSRASPAGSTDGGQVGSSPFNSTTQNRTTGSIGSIGSFSSFGSIDSVGSAGSGLLGMPGMPLGLGPSPDGSPTTTPHRRSASSHRRTTFAATPKPGDTSDGVAPGTAPPILPEPPSISAPILSASIDSVFAASSSEAGSEVQAARSHRSSLIAVGDGDDAKPLPQIQSLQFVPPASSTVQFADGVHDETSTSDSRSLELTAAGHLQNSSIVPAHPAFAESDAPFNRSRGPSVRNSILKERLTSNQSAGEKNDNFAGIPTESVLCELKTGGITQIKIKGQWWLISEWMTKELTGMTRAMQQPQCRLQTLMLSACFAKLPDEQKYAKFEEVMDAIECCGSLQHLDLSHNRLYDRGCKTLEEKLNHSQLITLDLSANSMTIKGANVLSVLITRLTTLERLSLARNALGIRIEPIMQAISTNLVLKDLDLAGNNLNAGGAESVARVLLTNKTVTDLNLSHNLLRAKGGIAIMQALKKNYTVQRIDLGWNDMGSEIGAATAAMLEANSSVCELILTNNNIQGPAGVTIAKSLVDNCQITQLDLSLNHLDGDVFDIFSTKVLMSRSVIENLDLSRNTVTWESGIVFLDALSANSTIISLDLSRTWGFTDKAPVERDATMGAMNPEIHTSPAQALEVVIGRNETLERLNLMGNTIGSLDGKTLSRNQTLKLLNLKHCDLGDSMEDVNRGWASWSDRGSGLFL